MLTIGESEDDLQKTLLDEKNSRYASVDDIHSRLFELRSGGIIY